MPGSTAVCNIGDAGVSRRRVGGWIALGLGIALGLALAYTGRPRIVRVALFAPFWLGALGLAQAQARTCIALAAQGMKDLDDGNGPVPLTDDAERRAVTARARGIHARALGFAVLLTIVAVLLPGPRSHPLP